MIVHIDFETHSALDLLKVGPWVYSCHPSTKILCLSWRTKDARGLWVSETMPGDHVPLQRLFNKPAQDRLFQIIATPGTLVEAHNVFFEKCIWWNIAEKQMFWPSIAPEQWRCSAAKAATCGLPRELGAAGRAMHLEVTKDEAARRIMLKLSRTGKGTKEEWDTLYKYCENDTAAEEALSDALPDLSPEELEVWQIDQEMNLRGIPCDTAGAQKAIVILDAWTSALNDELAKLTEGKVTKATQRQRLLPWLQENGAAIYDTQADTVDLLLKHGDGLTPQGRRAAEILRSIGHSSTAKYQTLIMSSDQDLMRDTQRYHGAGTGRWTASRFQPHNIPRGTIKTMELAWELIHDLAIEDIQLLFGDIMKFLSHALRGVIRAEEGSMLFCGDYAAIETRVLFWIANELSALAVLSRPDGDMYLELASDIYGRRVTKAEEQARQLGKQATLGLGFRMGYIKFLLTCRHYKIKFTAKQINEIVPPQEQERISRWIAEDDWDRCKRNDMTLEDLPELTLMKFVVDRYRLKFAKTVGKLWEDVENAAKAAVQMPGRRFFAGKCVWEMWKTFLRVRLPSGRYLYYPFANLEEKSDGYRAKDCVLHEIVNRKLVKFPFSGLNRFELGYMGVDSKTKQWIPERTYSGKLTENIVQAIARDVMCDGIRRNRNLGIYELLMLVHDEIVTQSARGNLAEFNALISVAPAWAPGLPMKAESWSGKRYKK